MLHFSCVDIFSNQILENKQAMIPLLVRGSQIGRKKKRFNIHVGGPFSAHNKAWRKCEVLLNQKHHIETIISKQSNQVRSEYRIRLNAYVTLLKPRCLVDHCQPAENLCVLYHETRTCEKWPNRACTSIQHKCIFYAKREFVYNCI